MEKSLADLKPGQRGRVQELKQTGALQRRLRDIGLIEGTEVACVFRRPKGSIAAFRIRGALIALRRADSRNITLFAGAKNGGRQPWA